MADPVYKLTIDLNALNHLGINLYSSIPAVISEVVANSWDADAELVTIRIDSDARTVTITDNGFGMTERDVNDRYLKVGYSKRDEGLKVTPRLQRPVMGRKGIGKLSLFSIANEIEVQTARTDKKGKLIEVNGFIMEAAEIAKRIKVAGSAGEYKPRVIQRADVVVKKGTRIVLRNLKNEGALSDGFLRRRLARRFSVIGAERQFEVQVNGKAIGIEDRDFLKSVQYLWTFGDAGQKVAKQCTNVKKHQELDPTVLATEGWRVGGWIGTFDERKSIDPTNNSIVVLARGKLVHEDLLKDLDEGALVTKYIIGELDADFIDLDDRPDISTSDRQRLREDDERFKALKKFVRDVVKKRIKANWTQWRNEGAEDEARKNPAIDQWFRQLPPDHRPLARNLFGRLGELTIEDDDTRRELYRQGILAFENLAFKHDLDALKSIKTGAQAQRLVEVIGTLDEIEAARFREIVLGRLEVLAKFQDVKDSALEKVLQQVIFSHLWLLHPSWERAATDVGMEVEIGKEFKKLDASLTKEEKKARLDIKYRTAAGKNIIIELKKYDRKVSNAELLKQIGKYRGAVQKVLKTKYPTQPQAVEFICVLGTPPIEWETDPQPVTDSLRAYDARFVTYDELLKQSRDAYREYLDAQTDLARIEELVDRI
jgi:hypothetical protein